MQDLVGAAGRCLRRWRQVAIFDETVELGSKNLLIKRMASPAVPLKER